MRHNEFRCRGQSSHGVILTTYCLPLDPDSPSVLEARHPAHSASPDPSADDGSSAAGVVLTNSSTTMSSHTTNIALARAAFTPLGWSPDKIGDGVLLVPTTANSNSTASIVSLSLPAPPSLPRVASLPWLFSNVGKQPQVWSSFKREPQTTYCGSLLKEDQTCGYLQDKWVRDLYRLVQGEFGHLSPGEVGTRRLARERPAKTRQWEAVFLRIANSLSSLY